jgi:hypothetical protein
MTTKTTTAAKFNIDQAIIEWKAEKIAEKFYAKWRAGEATDADTAEYHNRYNIARAEATTQPAEATTQPAEATTQPAEATTEVAFGTAWGTNGEVLSHEQTAEAINDGRGWFYQGRWVNKAGWDKEHAYLTDWLTAKLAAN